MICLGSKLMNKNCIEELTNHFYKLACEGRGSLTRGKYFQVLQTIEVAHKYNLGKLASYRPQKSPHKWLACIFDVVTDYIHGYVEQGFNQEGIKQIIQEQLQQTWQDFLTSVGKEANLSHVATLTDETIKDYLVNKSSLALEHGAIHKINIDSMCVGDIFCYLPNPPQDKAKHTIAATLFKDIRNLYNEAWYRTVQKWPRKDQPLFIYLFGCLPPSGTRLLNTIVVNLVETHQQYPEDYSFGVFYILVSDAAPVMKTDSALRGRYWKPVNCYISERDTTYFAEFFDRSRRGDRRAYELACLGTSATFPQAVKTLDEWLEKCEDFPELHGNELWVESVKAELNSIQAVESAVRTQVFVLLQKRGKA